MNDYILTKFDPKSEIYDVFFFALLKISIAEIPAFIKKIATISFSDCLLLENVIFPESSELIEICFFSFINSSIGLINFQPHLVSIGDGNFSHCRFIESFDSFISDISIPSNINLENGVF